MDQKQSQSVLLSPATVRWMGLEQMARSAGGLKKRIAPVKWAALALAKLRPGT